MKALGSSRTFQLWCCFVQTSMGPKGKVVPFFCNETSSTRSHGTRLCFDDIVKSENNISPTHDFHEQGI